MSAPSTPPPVGRASLRVKLIAVTLALLAFGLGLIGVGSVSILHGYLIDRVDAQITLITGEVIRRSQRGAAALTNTRLPPGAIVQLRDGGGAVVLTLNGMDTEGRQGPALPETTGPEVFTAPSASGDTQWRVRVTDLGATGGFVVAMDLAEVRQIIARLALIEALGGGGVMLLLAGIGIVIVRRSLRPLVEIQRTAEAIAAGELGRRVPDIDPRTEVGRLARSLNGMLAQIEAAFRARSESEAAARRSEEAAKRSEESARRSEERMRRFVADASHELRTPLTSIRGFAEFYRQNPEGDPLAVLRRVEHEAARMGLLVDDLLLLARLDRQRPLAADPVDLLALAADAVHDARMLDPDREVTLRVDGAALIVSGDEIRLRQVIGNLMTNALAHTPEGSPITVRVGASGPWAYLEVSDRGPGLTPEQAERVFERFYRADTSRARAGEQNGGTGLGLAIVAALVEAHHGTVAVDSAPGEGTTFRVRLPLDIG